MCWESTKTPIKRIAEEDIKVKKILFLYNNILRSPIEREFIWNKNILYTTELDAVSYNTLTMMYRIHKGFHTANSIGVFAEYWTTVYKNNEYITFTKEEGESVFDAIIPKGSEYYLNECGEYVSNQLIIYEEISNISRNSFNDCSS